MKEQYEHHTLPELIELANQFIGMEPAIALDYFEIVDGEALTPVHSGTKKIVALVAAKVGNTRLIDNVILA